MIHNETLLIKERKILNTLSSNSCRPYVVILASTDENEKAL